MLFKGESMSYTILAFALASHQTARFILYLNISHVSKVACTFIHNSQMRNVLCLVIQLLVLVHPTSVRAVTASLAKPLLEKVRKR